jgi:MFS family permease
MPAYSAFTHRNYRLYAATYVAVIGGQMTGIAIGWELYARTHSATALGVVGLIEALPIMLLSIPAGHFADQHDRKRIALGALAVVAITMAALGVVSYMHDSLTLWSGVAWINGVLGWAAALFGESHVIFTDPAVPWFFVLLLIAAVGSAAHAPARTAMMTTLVPASDLPNALTWNSSMFHTAVVVGPLFGGALIALTGTSYSVFFVDAVLCVVALGFTALIHYTHPVRERTKLSFHALGAGLRFVRSTEMVFAALTLDMFAVLLGGATALLPMFAKDILHVGADGLGWLRAAPAIGASITGFAIAHMPPFRRAGRTLLIAVIGFGLATIGFGISTAFCLSLTMLFLTGVFDNVSVVIRHTLVQTKTPEEMRGRVSAVNYVFIGASNELGAVESGFTAAIFGPMISVVAGGVGTIVTVLVTMLVWPALRKYGKLGEG